MTPLKSLTLSVFKLKSVTLNKNRLQKAVGFIRDTIYR